MDNLIERRQRSEMQTQAILPDNSIKDDSNCGTACKSHKHKHDDLFINVDLF